MLAPACVIDAAQSVVVMYAYVARMEVLLLPIVAVAVSFVEAIAVVQVTAAAAIVRVAAFVVMNRVASQEVFRADQLRLVVRLKRRFAAFAA